MSWLVARSCTVKTYTLVVEDGEVREKPYSRTGQRYRVTCVEVIKEDGNVSSVKLFGPVLKKDGTDSMNDAREHMHRHSEWPDWLRSAVRSLA